MHWCLNRLGDPLVFVDLGVLVLFLIELIFLHLLDVFGVDRTTLLVAPLALAAAWGGRLVLALHHSILGIMWFRFLVINLRQDCLCASIVPKVLVVVEDLQERGFKSAVELALFSLEPVHFLADQRVGCQEIRKTWALCFELLELLHVFQRPCST